VIRGPRLLAVATDAGGAANVAPVAALFTPQSRRVYCSDTTERIFRDCGVSDVLSWPEGLEASAVLTASSPDVVLAGTTRYASPDREILRAAGAAGVPTVAVLDEWFRYAERFRESVDAPLVLPDRICVQDALARDEAMAEGLPTGALIITGNPALCALADRIERFAASPPALPGFLSSLPRPWIVFVSEPHAEACGNEPGSRGPWGPFMGFTEHSVAEDLASVLRGTGQPCTVIDKLHPVAPESDVAAPLVAQGQVWTRVGRVPTDALFWHADLVVGMRSVALLEAAMAGRPVISYQPGLSSYYGPATCERLGLVPSTRRREELQQWLQAHWVVDAPHRPVRPGFATAGAPDRVQDVLVAAAVRELAQ